MCAVVMMGAPADAGRGGGGSGGGGGGGKPPKGSTTVGTPKGNFSCRAALARLEGAGLLDGVFVEVNAANPAQDPCLTDFAGILAELNVSKNLFHKSGSLGSTLLDVKLKVLYGGTQLLKDFKTSPAIPRKATAEAGVALIQVEVLGNFIEVAVLTSSAKAKCVSSSPPALSSDSQVVGLRINSIDIDLLSGHHEITVQVSAALHTEIVLMLSHLLGILEIDALINLGLTLHLNEEIKTVAADGGQVTRRALWLESNLIGDLIIAESIADYHGNPCDTTTGPPPPPPPPDPSKGWMTGGGRVNPSSGKVTHGFRLECVPSAGQNNLQVNWANNGFHLLTANTATCNNGPDGNNSGNTTAGFDTLTGTGTGRCRGGGSANASYTLIDNGEPGSADTMKITISGDCNLSVTVPLALERGNHQAHGRFA